MSVLLLLFLIPNNILPLLAITAAAVGGPGCPARDDFSLLALKHALSDPDGHLVSWSADVNCCLWVHVSCDATGVASLRLAGLNLSMFYNDAFAPLAALANLVFLDLSNNDFECLPIPARIFPHLPRLPDLNLSMSGFYGRVPPELGRVRKVVSLDLSQEIIGGLWVEHVTERTSLNGPKEKL